MGNRSLLLALVLASAANAQPLSCTLGSPFPREVRPESVADRTGDVLIACTGGNVVTGGPAPTATLSVTLPVPVTSRLLGSNNLGTLTEALLLIDDPAPGNQFPCAAISCPFVIGQPLGSGSGSNRNVYQGVLATANTIRFSNVPLAPPGSSQFRTFRVVNVRISGSSASSSFIDGTVSFLDALGSPVPLNTNIVPMAAVGPPSILQERNAAGGTTGIPPVYSASTPVNPVVNASTLPSFLLRFGQGGSGPSFFRRNPATSPANPSALSADNLPQSYGFVETGFYESAFTATSGLNVAGLATQGTRFEAKFSGIPTGVSLYVATAPDPLNTFGVASSTALVNPATGLPILPTVTIAGGIQLAQLSVNAGTADAVWEVLGKPDSDGEQVFFGFPVVVSYSSIVPAGAVTVGISLGPVDAAAAAASFSAPVPRFRSGSPITSFTISGPSVGPPSITTTSLPNGQQGVVYGTVNLGVSGGQSPYTWAITAGALPGGITLSPGGALSGTPTVNGTFNFTVRVTDSLTQTATANLSIVVRPPVSFSTTSVPDGQVGVVYASTTLVATGGLAPYTFSLASGALPGGITLSAGGTVSGTPTANGTFNFTARVTDSAGQTATVNLTSVIRPPVSISTLSLPSGQVTVAYSANVVGSGGSLPYSFAITAGSLPTGLTISSAGAITGTPSASGIFSFTARVTDGVGQTATANLSIVIGVGLGITSSTLPRGQVNLAYPVTSLLAAGGVLPLTWTISSGALPNGLTLSSAGAIAGTPTAGGTFTFRARVADSQGQNASADLTIDVQPPVTISTTALPAGQVGLAYPATNILAVGGTVPYTFSLASGALPGGLSLSTAGAITGTPTASGSFNFVARVTDNVAQTATASLSIVIAPALTVTGTSLPAGQVGVAYPATTLLATGGTLPYTWIVASGALPGGLTLSAAGAISGTPTATGSFTFKARVTDAPGQTATFDFAISVQSALTIITTSVPAGQVGVGYSTTLTQAGGTGPFTWSIAQGALPAGLGLSAAGAITGTPTVGGISNFIAAVADSRSFSANVSLSITTRNRVTVSSQILQDAELNRDYLGTLVAAGGLAPFTWRLVTTNTAGISTEAAGGSASLGAEAQAPQAGGSLPAGLSLSGSGFITGVPTATGNFGFTLGVTDAVGQQAIGEVQINVRGGFTIPTISLPSGAVECKFSSALQVTGGTPPFVWSAIGLPEGLSVTPAGQITGQPQSDGAFTATFIVTDANGQTVRQQLRFNVAPALAIVSPSSIDPVGTDQPVPVAFGASGGTPPYAFSIEGGSLPNGLSIDAQGLLTGRPTAAGSFGFSVKVADACGATARRSFPLLVLPSRIQDCSVAPQPESLKFTLQQGTGAVSRSIGLGGRCATPLSVSVQAESGGLNWLSAGPGSVTTSPLGPAGVTVTANPGSLPVGTYTGSVSLGGAAAASVPVVMTVVVAPVSMVVSPVGLTFTAVQGGPSPAPQSINVVALPQGPLSWSATTSTTGGGQWFGISNGAGATDTGRPGISTLSVRVSPVGLAPGEYYGVIEVTASGAANPNRSVTVVLNVVAADRTTNTATPTPDQAGLIMTGSAGRAVLITNPTRSPLSFTTSRHAIEGRLWFSVDPASGTIPSGGQLSIRIAPDLASLSEPGVRRSWLVLKFSDASSITIELVQIVPRIAAAPTSASAGKDSDVRAVAGCTPTRLVGVFTTLQNNFSIPVGWPAGVDMEIADDCAEPFSLGSATLGFSCCDSPKAMIPLRLGRWSATWVARAPQNTEVAVTGDFANDPRTTKGTHSVSGVIARTGNPPVIATGGAVSGATFGLGQPLAPGILASVFGQRLADDTAQSQSLPLSTTLGSTSASLGGKLLPLFFASDGQVNTQAPFDLPTNTELSLIVRRGGALSSPETVTIASAAPGMFTRNQRGTGQAAVVDVQGRVIEPGNAVGSGGVAILFATGLGAVDQTVLPGFPAPGAEPLARTIAPVVVTVGGIPAQVLYAGLAPGFVGLYQINFLIPSGVAPGDAVPLVISTAGATSTPGTMAIR